MVHRRMATCSYVFIHRATTAAAEVGGTNEGGNLMTLHAYGSKQLVVTGLGWSITEQSRLVVKI